MCAKIKLKSNPKSGQLTLNEGGALRGILRGMLRRTKPDLSSSTFYVYIVLFSAQFRSAGAAYLADLDGSRTARSGWRSATEKSRERDAIRAAERVTAEAAELCGEAEAETRSPILCFPLGSRLISLSSALAGLSNAFDCI